MKEKGTSVAVSLIAQEKTVSLVFLGQDKSSLDLRIERPRSHINSGDPIPTYPTCLKPVPSHFLYRSLLSIKASRPTLIWRQYTRKTEKRAKETFRFKKASFLLFFFCVFKNGKS